MARIAEAVLRAEGAVAPIGAFSEAHGVTLSLPGVTGCSGSHNVYQLVLPEAEQTLLVRSVSALKKAGRQLSDAADRWSRAG